MHGIVAQRTVQVQHVGTLVNTKIHVGTQKKQVQYV